MPDATIIEKLIIECWEEVKRPSTEAFNGEEVAKRYGVCTHIVERIYQRHVETRRDFFGENELPPKK